MAGEGNMILWWGSGSGPCWRAQIVLEEKSLKYDSRQIQFSDKGHKGPDVMKYNPRGQVPTFVHGDVVVNESLAICDYLDFAFPDQGSRLVPTDIKQRAVVVQRVNEAANLQKKGAEEIIYIYWRSKPEDIDQEQMKTKKAALADELKIWNSYIEKSGGTYVANNTYSMADVILFPPLAFQVRMGLKLDKWPNVTKFYNMMSERPAVKATWPPHWKDSEGKDFLADV